MNPPNHKRELPRFLQLMIENKDKPRKLEVRAEGDEATVYVYDTIDAYWGVSAAAFVKELAAITASTIHLRINSPGGDVMEARAIATAIKGHKAKVIAHIDGLCASAATFLAMAAAECEITEGGFLMIHNAWALAYGNASELRDLAALLEKIDETISADYQKKTGKSADEIAAWMRDETWFTAQEALDNGFVDRIFTGEAVENQWSLGAYAKAPKALTEPKAAPKEPAITFEKSYERIATVHARKGEQPQT